MESGRFAYKSIRLQDLRCFAYIEVDSPTRSEISPYIEAYY